MDNEQHSSSSSYIETLYPLLRISKHVGNHSVHLLHTLRVKQLMYKYKRIKNAICSLKSLIQCVITCPHILILIFMVCLVMRLDGVIDWSYWVIFIPANFLIAMVIALLAFAMCLGLSTNKFVNLLIVWSMVLICAGPVILLIRITEVAKISYFVIFLPWVLIISNAIIAYVYSETGWRKRIIAGVGASLAASPVLITFLLLALRFDNIAPIPMGAAMVPLWVIDFFLVCLLLINSVDDQFLCLWWRCCCCVCSFSLCRVYTSETDRQEAGRFWYLLGSRRYRKVFFNNIYWYSTMCAIIVFKILLSVKSALDGYQQNSTIYFEDIVPLQQKTWNLPYGVVFLPLLIVEFNSILCCAQLSCWFDEGDQEQRQRGSEDNDD